MSTSLQLKGAFIGSEKKWVDFIKFVQNKQIEIEGISDPASLLDIISSSETKPLFIAVDCSRFSDRKLQDIESLLMHPSQPYVIALVPASAAEIVPVLIKKGVPDVIREPVEEEHIEFILAKAILARELDDPNFVYLFPTDGSPISKRKLARNSLEKILSRFSLEEVISMRMNVLLDKKDPSKLEGLYAMVMKEVEKALLKAVLTKTGGNILKASSILGINRNTLAKKLKEYKIKK